ncbi:MAG: DUF4351 domain-containing protein [Okeania sp. SIO3I5]|uniref:DUF4351 domain-containing protein n=1 Tax=Okeania sp. SIO3I5 TaxID=2607805 RepID=UPI0013B6CAFA|nr:DUF4351 domain-containing protein [Okeania sp. SIO3I5]NEQ41973.1 DUF4351 domain-containing protein [Okeania sp. SIO3I5]
MMQESVIYQDILQKGKQIGEKRGLQIGLEQGEERGLQKGKASLVITLITYRFGNISEEIEAKIRSLSLSELNELAIALLNVTSLDDVMNWLSQFQN